MVDSNKIKELINESSEVFITPHKNIDLDALGSSLGLYYIANHFNKKAYIIIDDENKSKEVIRAISTTQKLDNIVISTYDEIKDKIDSKSLLIITDTNKASRVQNEKLLKIKNKILIDHHVKSDDTINNLSYQYVEVNESSATEIIMDLIDELNVYIPPYISTIMLSGIYVDTNGFMIKTNENTHLCSANLYKFGADNIEAQYLLKQDFGEFKRRQKLINNTEFYKNIAISIEDEKIYHNNELAKASDVLLTFNDVEISFVIAKIDEDTVGVSARSLGNIDVEKIMKQFGGGGHRTDAATQIKGITVLELRNKLLNYLEGVLK